MNPSGTWQEKLNKQLIAQFKRPELRPVVDNFFATVKQHCPDLGNDDTHIADYLLDDQVEGDARRFPVLWLLAAAEPFAEDEKLMQLLQDLFAYLLQTLVRKCEDKDNGLTKLPVKYRSTVELVDAAKKTAGSIPSYAEENLEFKNGRRNERFLDMGDFQPTSGSWDLETTCREIAINTGIREAKVEYRRPEWR